VGSDKNTEIDNQERNWNSPHSGTYLSTSGAGCLMIPINNNYVNSLNNDSLQQQCIDQSQIDGEVSFL
jgi:hypothetical protein